ALVRAAADPAEGLRTGLAALRAGAPEAAERLFARVAEAHPVVADHAGRLRLRALAEGGQRAALRREAARFLDAHAGAPESLRADVWRLRAEAAQAEGDGAAARAAWREARQLAADDAGRAAATAAIARSLEEEGRLDAAAEAWREL